MRPLTGILLVFVLFVIATTIILMPLYQYIVEPAVIFNKDLLPVLIIVAFAITLGCIIYYKATKPRKG